MLPNEAVPAAAASEDSLVVVMFSLCANWLLMSKQRGFGVLCPVDYDLFE